MADNRAEYPETTEAQEAANLDNLEEQRQAFHEQAEALQADLPAIAEEKLSPEEQEIEQRYQSELAVINTEYEDLITEADYVYNLESNDPEFVEYADENRARKEEEAENWREEQLGLLEERRLDDYVELSKAKDTFVESETKNLEKQTQKLDKEIEQESQEVKEFWKNYPDSLVEILPANPPPEVWDIPLDQQPEHWKSLENVPPENRSWHQYFGAPADVDIKKFLKDHPQYLTGEPVPAEVKAKDLAELGERLPIDVWQLPEDVEEPTHWKYLEGVPLEERTTNQYFDLPPEVDAWAWYQNNPWIAEGRQPAVEEFIQGLPPVPFASVQEESGATTWPELLHMKSNADWKAELLKHPELIIPELAESDEGKQRKKMSTKQAFLLGGPVRGLQHVVGEQIQRSIEMTPTNLAILGEQVDKYIEKPWAYTLYKWVGPQLHLGPTLFGEAAETIEPYGLPSAEEYREFTEAFEEEPLPVQFVVAGLNPVWWLTGTQIAGIGGAAGRIPGLGRVLEPTLKGAGGAVTTVFEKPVELAIKEAGKLGGKGVKTAAKVLDSEATCKLGVNTEELANLSKEEIEAMTPADLLKYKKIELGSDEQILANTRGYLGKAYKQVEKLIPETVRKPLHKLEPSAFTELPTPELFEKDPAAWREQVANATLLVKNRTLDELNSAADVVLRVPRSVGAPEGVKGVFQWKTDVSKLFGIDEKGYAHAVTPKPEYPDASMAIGFIVEHPYMYNLTAMQEEYIVACHNALDIFIDLAEREGVVIPQIEFEEGAHYFPRIAEGKMSETGEVIYNDVAPGIAKNWTKHRRGTQEELIEAGIRYVPLDEALESTISSINRATAEKKAAKFLEGVIGGSPERRVETRFPDIANAMQTAKQRDAQFKRVLDILDDAKKGAVLDPQTVASVSRFDPDIGTGLRDVMTRRRETVLQTEIKGYVMSEEEITRLAAERGYGTAGPSLKELNEMYVRAGGEELSNVDASILSEGLGLKLDALENQIYELQQDALALEARIAENPAKDLTKLIPRAEMAEGELKYITKGQYEKVFGRPPKASSLTEDGKRVRWEYALDDLARTLGYEERAVYEATSAEDLLRNDIQHAYNDKNELRVTKAGISNCQQEVKLTNELARKISPLAGDAKVIVTPDGKVRVSTGLGTKDATTKFEPNDLQALFGAKPALTTENALNAMISGKVLNSKEIGQVAEYLGFEMKKAPETVKGYKYILEGKADTPVKGAKFYVRNNREACLFMREVTERVKTGKEMPALAATKDKEAILKMTDEVKKRQETFKPEYNQAKVDYQRAKEITAQPKLDEARIIPPSFGGAIVDADLARAVNAKLMDEGQPIIRGMQSLAQSLRMFKASLDFSAPTIQLVPIMFRKPVLWGKAEAMQFKTAMSPGIYDRYIVKNMDDALSLAEHGGYIGSFEYTEAYEPIAKELSKRKITKVASPALNQTFGRFDAAFGVCGDYARVEMWKAMAPSVEREMGEEGLRRLARELNLMTGVVSSKGLGIGATQQQIESAFVFFAPRYTRAGFELMGDVFKGGWESKEAIEALGSYAAAGEVTYLGTCEALGQKAHLDPSKGNFKTIEIAEHNVGLGGFYTSVARLMGGIYSSFDEGEMVDLVSPLKTRDKDGNLVLNRWDNPFMKFLFGKTSMLSSTAYLMGIEQNEFLGEPFETTPDYIKFMAKQFTPIWIEDTFIEKGMPEDIPAGILTGLGSLAGLRLYPVAEWEQEKRLRDKYCREDFDRPYEDLDELERTMLYKAHGDLTELRDKKREKSAYYDDSLQPRWQEWNQANDKIRSDEMRGLQVAQDRFFESLSSGVENSWIAGKAYRDEVNKLAYGKSEAHEALEAMDRYAPLYEIMNREPDPDRVPMITVAGWEYDNMLYDNPELEELDGKPEFYEYRDKLIDSFVDKWGRDVYNQVKQIDDNLKKLQGYPTLYLELRKARRILEPYWKIQDRYDEELNGASPERTKEIEVLIEAEQVQWRVDHPEGDYFLSLFYGKKPLIEDKKLAKKLDAEIRGAMAERASTQETRIAELLR